MRQIILDTETTGLSPEKGHRIIEVGCLEMVNRQITDNHFHFYINPRREIEKEAEAVHGITSAFLEDKPFFEDIAEDLLDYLRGAELVIHNAPFDVGFLNHEFKRVNKKPKTISDHCSVLDTLVLARRKHPGQKNTLDALCRRYNVDNTNRELHGALLDAELLAQVYLLMTGGQTQLFEASQEQVRVDRDSQIKRLARGEKSLAVLSATSEELAAHDAFMKKLREE